MIWHTFHTGNVYCLLYLYSWALELSRNEKNNKILLKNHRVDTKTQSQTPKLCLCVCQINFWVWWCTNLTPCVPCCCSKLNSMSFFRMLQKGNPSFSSHFNVLLLKNWLNPFTLWHFIGLLTFSAFTPFHGLFSLFWTLYSFIGIKQ